MPTTIGWTDETWNPGIAGCSDASHGCTHCYAKIMAHRLAGMPAMKHKYAGTTKRSAGGKIHINFDKNIVMLNDGQFFGTTDHGTWSEMKRKYSTSEWNRLNPTVMHRSSKKESGNLLDGVRWEEFPRVAGAETTSPQPPRGGGEAARAPERVTDNT